MKLISAHVANFGRLSNFDIDFDEKITVINRNNGWGKSTFAAFIRVMLFGFEGEKKASELEKERVRFKPWQGGTYGGNLVINVEGRSLRIERTFGEKASADKFAVYDVKTNLPCGDFTEKIGEEILGINSESFKKSVFITQNEVATKATDSINAKIGSREGELNDMSAYEDAIGYIEDTYVKLSATRKTGALAKLRDEITALETKIAMSGDLVGSMEKIREKKQSVSADIEKLSSKQKELSELQGKVSIWKEKESKREIYKSYEDDYRSKLEAVNTFKAGIPVDLEKAEKSLDQWNAVLEARTDLADQKAKAESLRQLAEKQRVLKNIFGTGFIITGVVLGVIGGTLATFINPIVGLLIGVVGIALLFFGIIELRKIEYKYRTNIDLASTYEKTYRELQNTIEIALGMIKDFLIEFGIVFNESTAAANLSKLVIRAKDYELRAETLSNLNAELARSKGRLDKYRIENNIEEVLNDDVKSEQGDLAAISAELQSVIEDIDAKRSELSIYSRQQDETAAKLEDINEAETVLTELREQADALAKKCDLLGTTGIYLRKAKEALTGRYMSPLKNSFDKYYDIICGACADDYDIDANAKLTLRAEGVLRDIGYLSSGLRDVTGLCMRLAFVDAMYGDEKPMIILDDPFVNLDPHNLEGAKRLIDTVSQDYQIVMFSCHYMEEKV